MTSEHHQMRPARTNARTVSEVAAMLAADVLERGGAPWTAPGTDGIGISGVVTSSSDVQPGDLFVALQGFTVHGAAYVDDALARGARAVLTDDEGRRRISAQPVAGDPVPILVLPVGADPRATVSLLARWFHGDPSEALRSFAVTGTNGKTTTTYLLDHLARACGETVGLIGTVETRSGHRVLPSRLTTPDAATLQSVLAVMREDGVTSLAMEVSSHALALHRVDGVVFDVVGFTNLSQDHLDFHETFDEYFAAKASLFTPDRARRGVVVVDDEWGRALVARAQIPVSSVSVSGADADWTVTDVRTLESGQSFTLRHRDGRSVQTSTALPGGFNVANAALALAMVIESGTDVDELSRALDRTGGLSPVVPGRMEVLGTAPRVVVDFAHNADALELALGALRPSTSGRLVVVFGATGDRDRGKRPTMGAVAARGADVVVVTDDDPHGEPSETIRAEVLAGARAEVGRRAASLLPVVEVLETAPRDRAIREAVLGAGEHDTVLVAGRGHEVWQEIDGVNHPLDDRVEVRAALAARADEMKEHGE